MPDYERAGSDQLDAYKDAVSADRPDTPYVSDVAQYDNQGYTNFLYINAEGSGYRAFDSEVDPLDKNEDARLMLNFKQEDLGFDPTPMFSRMAYRIKVTNGIEIDNEISQGIYDTQGEWAIVESEFKEADNNPGKKLPVNELTWQSHHMVSGVNSGNLKVMFIENVRSDGFWEITKQNYIETNKQLDQMAVWAPGSAEDTARFNRFLGSDNMNGKFHARMNHHRPLATSRLIKLLPCQNRFPGQAVAFRSLSSFETNMTGHDTPCNSGIAEGLLWLFNPAPPGMLAVSISTISLALLMLILRC